MKIAYLGPSGTFTEAALWEFVARGALPQPEATLPVRSPNEAVRAVGDGTADAAVVAIENSVDGPVTPTFDALAAVPGVQIRAELDLSIAFALMTKQGKKVGEARRIATHPVAFQQVKGWLAQHAPEAEFVAASSNAAAASMVANGEADLAAAPARAAEVYDLEIQADGIADVAGARTRFVVVTEVAEPPAPTGADRSSVVFELENVAGSLVGALTEFSLREVDLCRIESRPVADGLGTYRFYVDVRGHIADEPVAEALKALHPRCEQLRFLGSWPTGKPSSDEERRRALEAAGEWVEAARQGRV